VHNLPLPPATAGEIMQQSSRLYEEPALLSRNYVSWEKTNPRIEGVEANFLFTKTKRVLVPTRRPRAGWPKRLVLVGVNPLAEYEVTGV